MSEIYVDPTIDIPVVLVDGQCYQLVGPSSMIATSAIQEQFETCHDCQTPPDSCINCAPNGTKICYSLRTMARIQLDLTFDSETPCSACGQQNGYCGYQFSQFLADSLKDFTIPANLSSSTPIATFEPDGDDPCNPPPGNFPRHDCSGVSDTVYASVLICSPGECDPGVTITLVTFTNGNRALTISGTLDDSGTLTGPVTDCCDGTPSVTGTGTITLIAKDCHLSGSTCVHIDAP